MQVGEDSSTKVFVVALLLLLQIVNDKYPTVGEWLKKQALKRQT